MTPSHPLLLAARRCERGALERLAATAELIVAAGRLIHTLQRERGTSAIYLASDGRRFTADRAARIADSQAAEASMGRHLALLAEAEGATSPAASLLYRAADVGGALEELTKLRRAVAARALDPDASTAAYNRLIGALLGLVFDTVDAHGDTRITVAMVALCHLLKGKELAGQERACGAQGFTAGHFDDGHRALLTRLADAQAGCFTTFLEFASPDACEHWASLLANDDEGPLPQLRRLAMHPEAAAGQSRDAARLGEVWYELTTRRIDAMYQVEKRLGEELMALCAERLSTLRQPPPSPPAPSDAARLDAAPLAAPDVLDGQAATAALASPLNRSLLDLVRTQADRLQSLGHELESTRKALRERKLIERAKGVIMASQRLTEEQAYRYMRKTAMDQSRSMADLARAILDLAELLKAPGPGS